MNNTHKYSFKKINLYEKILYTINIEENILDFSCLINYFQGFSLENKEVAALLGIVDLILSIILSARLLILQLRCFNSRRSSQRNSF